MGNQMANDLLSMMIELGLLDQESNNEIKWLKHTEDYMNDLSCPYSAPVKEPEN